MSIKKDETASFMLRFTQKIFQNESGESQVQWRGNIRHVQGGDEQRFSKFDEAVSFMQSKLAEMTIQQMEDKSPEEQKGILSKSFDLWKKMAMTAPKVVMDTIKDPKGQVEKLQSEIQNVGEAIKHQVGDRIGQKMDVDDWRGVSKSDHKKMMDMMEKNVKRDSQAKQKGKVKRLSSRSSPKAPSPK